MKLAIVALVLGLVGAALRPIEGYATERARDEPGATVVAESQFGNGSVTGLVRAGANGTLQVQLPSGTWTDCRSSCRETLRVETVDFWQAQAKTTNECGIFGCLELRYPRR